MVTSLGEVYLHPRRRGEPQEWAWVAAHCLLHLGFDHLAENRLTGWSAAAGLPSGRNSRARFDAAWNLAACVTVNRFLAHLKIGRPPEGLGGPTDTITWPGQRAARTPSPTGCTPWVPRPTWAGRGPAARAATCAGRASPRATAGAGRRTGPTGSRPGWPARSAPPWTSRAA